MYTIIEYIPYINDCGSPVSEQKWHPRFFSTLKKACDVILTIEKEKICNDPVYKGNCILIPSIKTYSAGDATFRFSYIPRTIITEKYSFISRKHYKRCSVSTLKDITEWVNDPYNCEYTSFYDIINVDRIPIEY